MPSSHFCTHPLFFFFLPPLTHSPPGFLSSPNTHANTCALARTLTHILFCFFFCIHIHTNINTHCCGSKDTPGQHLPAGEPKDPPLNTHAHTHTHTRFYTGEDECVLIKPTCLHTQTHTHMPPHTIRHTHTHIPALHITPSSTQQHKRHTVMAAPQSQLRM